MTYLHAIYVHVHFHVHVLFYWDLVVKKRMSLLNFQLELIYPLCAGGGGLYAAPWRNRMWGGEKEEEGLSQNYSRPRALPTRNFIFYHLLAPLVIIYLF